ncbi:MAG: oligosaccharide flippase family protein [Lachnospiraceae bacterium]|nr:oligosaccharide flippase family protein [Lachnospiraceae bacterium]
MEQKAEEQNQEKKSRNLFAGFLEYFYGNFIVLLLGVVSLPLITRVMSTDEYGRTAMFTSAVSIIYIAAILGMDQSYIRYFYKEGVNRKRLILQCLQYPVLLILLLAGAYCLFADLFNGFLFGRTGTDITILVVSYTIISVFERFGFLNIRMDQNGKLYSNLNILSKVLYIGFILLFVRLIGDDFRVVLYAMTLPLFIVTVFVYVRYLIVNRRERAEKHAVTTRELLIYGVPFVPMLLMEWLLSSMDKWSIKLFKGFSDTGIYNSAMQIMTILLTFKITYVAFWAPVAMEKYEQEPEEVCKPFFADMFQKVQFLAMAAAFLLTIFRGVIVLILGENYRGAIRVIPFLTLMPVLSILFEMTGQGCKFVGKAKYFNYASLAAIAVNLTGNTLLVPVLGEIGAALATAVTYIVYFLIGTYFSVKCYPVDYRLRTFGLSLVLYSAYAAYATFTDRILLSALIGIVPLLLHILLNKAVLASLWKYAWQFLKRKKV